MYSISILIHSVSVSEMEGTAAFIIQFVCLLSSGCNLRSGAKDGIRIPYVPGLHNNNNYVLFIITVTHIVGRCLSVLIPAEDAGYPLVSFMLLYVDLQLPGILNKCTVSNSK